MGSFFQSPEWEEFKIKTGYEKSHRIDGVLVLQKKLPFGRTMLYSPMANKNLADRIQNREFVEKIQKIAHENNSIFYRLELDIPKENTTSDIPHTLQNFVKSFEEMQPEHNWVLDITKPEEELLSEMKQKCRYNIKVAEKNGVKVSSSTKSGKELDAFYDQYSKTGLRHKVTFRGKAYFEKLLDILGEKGYARVYEASAKIDSKETTLASAVMIFYGSEALYLYGGSSDENKNLMAPYLLHWEIIKEAKKAGCKRYNFLGISENDDPNHPWAGITRFKKQFGGFQEDLLGSYDLIFKPFEYQVFKIAEKIRRR